MNKKGQALTVIFFVLMFVIVWIMFFAEQLSYWGEMIVVNGGYTGFPAFFYNNLNLLIGVGLLLFIMGSIYFSQER